VACVSATAGTMDGVSTDLVNLHRVVGHILATGNRTSQNGQSDEFAGTGTEQYAMVYLDASASWAPSDNG